MAPSRPLALAVAISATSLACAAPSGPGGRPGSPSAALAAEDMVLVKGGCYRMGAALDDCDANPEERPAHEVCVGDFLIGRTEVTQGQWRSVMGSDTTASSTCADADCPVDNVGWSDVQQFIERLNARTGARYRLPTEAEWEYAARSGGKNERYAGGSSLAGRLAWFSGNSELRNHRVATKAPNGLGLYDMSGNVWEMTGDWYSPSYYATSPRDNPTGPSTGDDHVVRGGCRTGGLQNQRTTRRTFIGDRTNGTGRGGNVGFRLAMTP